MSQKGPDASPWMVTPFEGAGPLRFGMDRDEVVGVLGEPDRVITSAPILTESYREAKVRPAYDDDRRLLSIEAILDKGLAYENLSISAGQPVEDVRRHLESAGIPYRWSADEDELTIPELGVSIFAPSHGYRPGRVQAVLITRRDYDEVADRLLA